MRAWTKKEVDLVVVMATCGRTSRFPIAISIFRGRTLSMIHLDPNSLGKLRHELMLASEGIASSSRSLENSI